MDAAMIHHINELLENAKQAAAIFSQFNQEQTDRIVRAVYQAGMNHRVRLAKMAVEETGMGRWEDKVLKNVVATQYVYEDIKDQKTVGVISDDEVSGITEIAQPAGPILAVVPVTNPTSTTLFKVLIALKTRNPIIISPHPRATKCSTEAARICYEAALKEDAPEYCVQWVNDASHEQTQALMKHRDLALVLATGGGGLVKEAYSSGNPALGVGSGNVPVLIEKSADVPFAAAQIFTSKTFDNGTICSSEQAIVVEEEIAGQLEESLIKLGSHFLDANEVKTLTEVVYDPERRTTNAHLLGKSAAVIGTLAGLDVPPDTQLLIAPLAGIGEEYPLSGEILAPILAYYVARDFSQALCICMDLNFYGGMGHSASIYSNDPAKIIEFSQALNAGRILVNTPSSQGAIGGMYNTLHSSLTLGCGTAGKNITTDNISANHLLNIQRIARRRMNQKMFAMDPTLYLDERLDAEAIERHHNLTC